MLDAKHIHLALGGSVLAGLFACAARGSTSPVGVSHGMPPDVPRDAGALAPFVKVVDGGIDTSGLERLSPEGYTSVGHASGRFTADVFANDVALPIFKQGVGTFPSGSVLLMTHRERSPDAREGDRAAGPTFRMEKSGTGWRYSTVSKAGVLLADGTPESCVACHDDAPRDHVFPLLPTR